MLFVAIAMEPLNADYHEKRAQLFALEGNQRAALKCYAKILQGLLC